MKLLDSLERRFGQYAVPGVTLYLVFLQSLCFLLTKARPGFEEHIALIPILVLHGEVWRLFTFLIVPGSNDLIWLVFELYFFYFMGTALETNWGTFRYNVYLLIGWLATVAASFLQPAGVGSNVFLEFSVLLAFAYLYPEFQILLFFILPVKMKWISLFAWIGLGLALIVGPTWMLRIMALAGVANFLFFFGPTIFREATHNPRTAAKKAKRVADKAEPFHTCVLCGVTDKSNRKMEFRYCPDCAGTPCYCIDHINAHEHKVRTEDGGLNAKCRMQNAK